MAKITKSLSSKVNKQTGKVEIYFRFIGSSTLILRAKSGIFIDPKQWNDKKGELKSATFGNEQAETKLKLDNLCAVILNTFTQTDNELVNKEWLNTIIDQFHYPEKYVTLKDTSRQNLIEAFEEFLQVHKVSLVRKRSFKVLFRALRRYELYSDITLELDTTTDKIIRDIEKFFREEYILCDNPKYQKVLEAVPESRQPQPRGHNTICSLLSKLRVFWLWCVEQGKTQNRLKIEVRAEIYGTPYYITIDERKQIERADLSAHPQLAIQRDIFIFQCCVGCRIGDLYKFTKQNIVNGVLEYIPHKTRDGRPVTVSVPLNSVALAILSRYEVEASDSLLPYISEQKYNNAIKRIFKLSGIERIVQVRNPLTGDSEPKPICDVASSHLARRTFVGNLYKQVKDPNLVGALSGHKEGSRAFARYRDIDNDMKVELVKLLE